MNRYRLSFLENESEPKNDLRFSQDFTKRPQAVASRIMKEKEEKKMSYISFQNIVKNFGETKVLKGIDLEIERGELVTLLGPSGCGKSTLLRCLAGLEEVTSGRIFLEGNEITNVSPKNRGIGMVFQQYSLFPNMTVEENVEFGLKQKKMPKEDRLPKVSDMLEIVGLEKQRKQYPRELSGGQQQRAALARALVTEPKVLLLDEPLSAIDAKLRKALQMEIRRIKKELCITAVFVTHDQEEAMVMSDKIHLMNGGKIEQSATPEVMYTKPVSHFAASFIGNYNLFTEREFLHLAEIAIHGEEIAIRPEIIRILGEEDIVDERFYHFEGRLMGYVPHGNVMRYEFHCGTIKVQVDALHDIHKKLAIGEDYRLAVKREDCILL